MSKSKPTFQMPAQLRDDWLAALRSGEFEQTDGTLMRTDEDGQCSYCCLGVLQKVADGQVTFDEDGPANLPSKYWFKKHGFRKMFGLYQGPGSEELSPVVRWNDDQGRKSDDREYDLSFLNDNENLTFPEIADLIQDSSEGI